MNTGKLSSRWIDRLFGVSLALLGVSSLILSVTALTGTALPDWAVRLLGIVNLVSLPVLICSMVKSFQEKAGMRRAAEAKTGRGSTKKKKKGKKR